MFLITLQAKYDTTRWLHGKNCNNQTAGAIKNIYLVVWQLEQISLFGPKFGPHKQLAAVCCFCQSHQ